MKGSIGVFDSGYGGLTVLREIVKELPDYHYVYLGDNARNPYGSRSFDVVYRNTLQCVESLFNCDCPLVVLACNTASAKALRNIQQIDLPRIAPENRVLGVIRPSVEAFASISQNHHIGILATRGTVSSKSYLIESDKLYGTGEFKIAQVACPMFVPLVENHELEGMGAEYFVKKSVDELLHIDSEIDTIVLGCTHFPLLRPLIEKFTPKYIKIVNQGNIIADSLKDYLLRHEEMKSKLTQKPGIDFYTTESTEIFNPMASLFMNREVEAKQLII